MQTTRSARWLVLLSLTLSLCRLAGEDRTVSEYQVKAAFLYNFTKFVDWPAGAFASTNAPFVIGIWGDDPFNENLDNVVHDESVHGHPLVVKRLRGEEDLAGCHMLFISRAAREKRDLALERVRNRPILTIGDTDGFARQGVMVNLVLIQGSVKMEINRQAAEQTGLQISSKLLSLAQIVETGEAPSKR